MAFKPIDASKLPSKDPNRDKWLVGEINRVAQELQAQLDKQDAWIRLHIAQLRCIVARLAPVTAPSPCAEGTVTPPPAPLPDPPPPVPQPPAPASSVVVTLFPATILVGQDAQASALVKDASGNVLVGRVVTWMSSDVSRATVDSAGNVTGISAGTASITATCEGVSNSATITVSAPPPPATVSSVTVTISPATIQVGQQVQAIAVVRDSGGNVLVGKLITWSSTNSGVASVNAAGLVTGVIAGQAEIIASCEGVDGDAPISVIVPPTVPTSITVTLFPTSIQAAQTSQASAVVRDQNGNVMNGVTVEWSSSDTTKATVSNTGLVTGISAGTANIIATLGSVTGQATVTVIAAPPPAVVATVTVSLTSPILVGQQVQATAVVRDAGSVILTGKVVTWASSNPAVATVTTTGLITGVSAGTVTITATCETVPGTASLTVNSPPPPPPAAVATVTVTAPDTSLDIGQSVQASTILRDANGALLTGRIVTWSSSAPTSVTVSASGVVTAIAVGGAIITATCEGKTGTLSFSVNVPVPPPPPPPVVGSVIISGPTAVNVGDVVQYTATVLSTTGSPMTGQTVTWSISTPNTISSNGLATFAVSGGALITATVSSVVGSLNVVVNTVAPPPATTYADDLYTKPAGVTRNLSTGSITSYPVNVSFNLPVGGIERRCSTSAELATAFANCANNDIIKVLKGVTYRGPTLRNRGAGGAANPVYVIVCDSNWVFSPPCPVKTRAGKQHSGGYAIFTNDTSANSRALLSNSGAAGYRFVGIEFRPINGTVSDSVLVYPGSHIPTTSGDQCDNIGFDRCLIHGNGNRNISYGLVWRAKNSFCVDTSIVDIARAGTENKAMLLSSCTGPFAFINTRFQGASVNVMFGGEVSAIPDTVVSDTLFHHCYFDKDPLWINAGFACKNLVELKAARRVMFDTCILENSGAEGQQGWVGRITSSWSIDNDNGLAPGVTSPKTVVSSTATTITFAGGSFTVGALVGKWILVGNFSANNDGLTRRFRIAANTTDTLTVDSGDNARTGISTDASGLTGFKTWFLDGRVHRSNTENITYRWCIGRNVPSVWGIDGNQSNGNSLGTDHTRFVEVRDFLAYNLNKPPFSANPASFNTYLQLSGEGVTEGVVLNHITMYAEDSSLTAGIWLDSQHAQAVWKNSIISACGNGGLRGSGLAAGKVTLDNRCKDLAGVTPDYIFKNVLMIGGTASDFSGIPGPNYIGEILSNVGFANPAASDFRLVSGQYRAGQSRAADDGTDIGASVAEIVFRTAGVATGVMP